MKFGTSDNLTTLPGFNVAAPAQAAECKLVAHENMAYFLSFNVAAPAQTRNDTD